MSSAAHSAFLSCLLLTACADELPLLSVRSEALAQDTLALAQPPIVTAVGFVALSAAFCGMGDAAWEGAPSEIEAPSSIAEWFDMSALGLHDHNPSTGVHQITFSDARVLGYAARIQLSATTPTESLRVMAESDEKEPVTLTESHFTATGCEGKRHRLQGEISFATAEQQDQKVLIPTSDESSEGAMVFDGISILPLQGDLAWSGTADSGRVSLKTVDASAIEEEQGSWRWDATIEGRSGKRWVEEVQIVLP